MTSTLPLRLLDAGRHGRRLAVVAPELHDAQPRVLARKFDGPLERAVRLPSLTNTISNGTPSGSTAATMAACMRTMLSSSL